MTNIWPDQESKPLTQSFEHNRTEWAIGGSWEGGGGVNITMCIWPKIVGRVASETQLERGD